MPATAGWLLAVAVAVGLTVLLGACGDDADGGRSEAAGDRAADDRGGRHGDEPEATDPDEVRPYVEDLLRSHDLVVDQIITDPGVAADRDDPLVQQYLRLYEPDSDFAEGILDAWAADGEEGVSIQPYDDAHPANATTIDGEIEVVSPDEVRVPFCLEQRQIVYRDEQPVQGLTLLERPGEVIAVRIDGEWLLRSRNVFGDRSECGGEGS